MKRIGFALATALAISIMMLCAVGVLAEGEGLIGSHDGDVDDDGFVEGTQDDKSGAESVVDGVVGGAESVVDGVVGGAESVVDGALDGAESAIDDITDGTLATDRDTQNDTVADNSTEDKNGINVTAIIIVLVVVAAGAAAVIAFVPKR